MKLSRRAVIGILLFGLFLLAGILLRSVILEYFIKPIALLLWVTNRIFISVDQVVYWFGLVLVMLVVTFYRISFQTKDLETFHHISGNTALENMNQWRTTILITQEQADRANILKQNLATLLRDIYASRQPNLAPWKIYDAFERGDIPMPDSIQTFLMLNRKERPSMVDLVQYILKSPIRWVRHRTGQDVRDYYAAIDEVIAFMEKKLESEDDE